MSPAANTSGILVWSRAFTGITPPRTSSVPLMYSTAGCTPSPKTTKSGVTRLPSESTRTLAPFSSAIRVTVFPRCSTAPLSSWRFLSKAAIRSPSTRARGRDSGEITVTESPLSRSELASSMPMNPAPMRAALFAVEAAASMALASARLRRLKQQPSFAPGIESFLGVPPVASRALSNDMTFPPSKTASFFRPSKATTR